MLVIILNMTYEHVKRVGGEVGGKKIKQQHQKKYNNSAYIWDSTLYQTPRFPSGAASPAPPECFPGSLKFRSGYSIPAWF